MSTCTTITLPIGQLNCPKYNATTFQSCNSAERYRREAALMRYMMIGRRPATTTKALFICNSFDITFPQAHSRSRALLLDPIASLRGKLDLFFLVQVQKVAQTLERVDLRRDPTAHCKSTFRTLPGWATLNLRDMNVQFLPSVFQPRSVDIRYCDTDDRDAIETAGDPS